MSHQERRKRPEDLTDDELLERIAEKDSEKFELPEIAERALDDQEDSS